MLDSLRYFPRAMDPLIAIAFGLLWTAAEVGRAVPLPGDRGALWGVWWVLGLTVLAMALPRVAPTVALVVATAIPVLQIIRVVDPPGSTSWPIYGGLLYVAFVVASSAPRRLIVPSLIVTVVQAPLIAFARTAVGQWRSWTGMRPPRGAFDDLVLAAQVGGVALAALLCAWGGGYLLRVVVERRRERTLLASTVEDLAEASGELDRVRERARIAQEVHDVLAHSLAVVVAMADGARFIREKRPETTDASLRDIAGAARDALVDLRGLMEELTDQTERPLPGLADVDALVERLGAAGLIVTVDEFGERGALTPTQGLAVYRILQEALTNALKHAGHGPRASVSLEWRGPGLSVSVRSRCDGQGEPSQGADAQSGGGDGRRGFGLRGMADRARLAGGWLTAEPSTDDGDDSFVVTAFIPESGRSETNARSASDARLADARLASAARLATNRASETDGRIETVGA